MLTFDRPSMLLSWTGGVEVDGTGTVVQDFAGSMRFAPPSTTGAAAMVDGVDNDDAMDQLITKLTTWWSAPGTFVPRNFVIKTVKWNRLDLAGHYASSQDTRQREGLAINGGASAIYPHFVALAVTWNTNARRGLARAGRTYLPTAAPVDGLKGTLTAAAQASIGATSATFINDAGNWDGLDTTNVVPSVMSGLRGGNTRPITAVAVGNEFDTVRRRKAKREKYVLTAVV
jgi:hypothetical protein